MMSDAMIEALRAWDAYEPDITTERMVKQANAMAEAIRAVLAPVTPALIDRIAGILRSRELTQYDDIVRCVAGELSASLSANRVTQQDALIKELVGALEAFAQLQMTVVSVADVGVIKKDLDDCSWIAGFTGPAQPQFRHYAAARAAIASAKEQQS